MELSTTAAPVGTTNNNDNVERMKNDESSSEMADNADPVMHTGIASSSMESIAQLADVISETSTSSRSGSDSPAASTGYSSPEEEEENNDDEDSTLKIPFAAGDHITRWEMLPIAWPIQVHGIVLEVNEDKLILVDFGLAAVPDGDAKEKGGKNNNNKGEEKGSSDGEENDNDGACGEQSRKDDNDDEEGERNEGKKDQTEDTTKQHQQDHVKKAIEKVQKGFKIERKRLNIRTLTSQKDVSTWSKVNYDGGFFGFGNKDGNGGEEGNRIQDEADVAADDEQPSIQKQKSPCTEKRESWWDSWIKPKEMEKAENNISTVKNINNGESSNTLSDDTVATNTRSMNEVEIKTNDSGTPTTMTGCGAVPSSTCEATQWLCPITLQRGKRRKSASALSTSSSPKHENSESIGTIVDEYRRQNAAKDDTDFALERDRRQMIRKEGLQQDDCSANEAEATSPTRDADSSGSPDTEEALENAANGIVVSNDSASLEEEEKKDNDEAGSSFSSSVKKGQPTHLSIITDEPPQNDAAIENAEDKAPSSSETQSESASPKSQPSCDETQKKRLCRNELSKADPTAVVLARTWWLIEHGENMLPPYHAFSSNSECIAVFCKTGYWSTLQADIFLHSTAIGNAKSTVVMTLGVVASVPFLAPVVGAVGLGAIVAPWLYLDNQKKAARKTQQTLSDQFWAQAKPEVFVECIKAWSNLEPSESQMAPVLVEKE